MSQRRPRMVITGSGGLVRTVYSDASVEVWVVDWDEYGHDEADSEIEADSPERIGDDARQRFGPVVIVEGDRVRIDREQFPRYQLLA